MGPGLRPRPGPGSRAQPHPSASPLTILSPQNGNIHFSVAIRPRNDRMRETLLAKKSAFRNRPPEAEDH